MKRIKLFEQFVNEKLNRRDLKEVKNLGFEASLEGDTIKIIDENPFGDDNTYTFYWNGEEAWCEAAGEIRTGGYYHEEVTSAKELSDAMNDTDNWI